MDSFNFCFFFSSRRRHTRCGRDWSSDVCSSDLNQALPRTGSTITGVNSQGAQTPITAPRTMLGSADGTSIILLGGNGSAYSYDGLSDAYSSTARLFGATQIPGIPGGG